MIIKATIHVEHVEGKTIGDSELESFVGRTLLDANEDMVWGGAEGARRYRITEVIARRETA